LRPAAGGRLAGDGRRARTNGGRDEPGFQCSLHLLGRKTRDLQGPFEVSLDGGAYKLKRRMKVVLHSPKANAAALRILTLKRMANVFPKIANFSMKKFFKWLSNFII